MIDANTGEIALSDTEIIIPKMSIGEFAANFPDAALDWEHNTRAAYKISRRYDSGWQARLTLHFTEDTLYDVLLRFHDGSDSDDDDDNAYEKQVNLHLELLKEWLGQDPPYHYDWGVVQLLKDSPYSHHFISVQYT